jgi:excisionase family DNA binding protein
MPDPALSLFVHAAEEAASALTRIAAAVEGMAQALGRAAGPGGPLYRVEDAAVLLGIKPGSLRKLIAAGKVTSVRPTVRTVRIPEDEVLRLQQHARRPRDG